MPKLQLKVEAKVKLKELKWFVLEFLRQDAVDFRSENLLLVKDDANETIYHYIDREIIYIEEDEYEEEVYGEYMFEYNKKTGICKVYYELYE